MTARQGGGRHAVPLARVHVLWGQAVLGSALWCSLSFLGLLFCQTWSWPHTSVAPPHLAFPPFLQCWEWTPTPHSSPGNAAELAREPSGKRATSPAVRCEAIEVVVFTPAITFGTVTALPRNDAHGCENGQMQTGGSEEGRTEASLPLGRTASRWQDRLHKLHRTIFPYPSQFLGLLCQEVWFSLGKRVHSYKVNADSVSLVLRAWGYLWFAVTSTSVRKPQFCKPRYFKPVKSVKMKY